MTSTSIYVNRFSREPGSPEFCRAGIWNDIHSHQCGRKPTVFRAVEGRKGEFGFCKQHDPVEVEKKDAARRAKWAARSKAQSEAWARQDQRAAALDACKVALEQIAAGHNDPRALAAETLALFPKEVDAEDS